MGRNRRIFVVRAGSAGEAGHVPSPEVPATVEERVELVDRVILVRARRVVPES